MTPVRESCPDGSPMGCCLNPSSSEVLGFSLERIARVAVVFDGILVLKRDDRPVQSW